MREDEIKKNKAMKKHNHDFNLIPSFVSQIKKEAKINKAIND